MVQGFRVLATLTENLSWVLAPTSDGSQPLVTLLLGDLMLSSAFQGHLHSCKHTTYRHIHVNKNEGLKF